MISNTAAELVLGTLGSIFWSTQLIPQVIKSYRTKSVDGLSSWMLLIWWVGGIFLGSYVIVEGFNLPLIIQPQCFNLLATLSWGQCMYYGQGWPKRTAILAVIGACILSGTLELAFIFGSRALERLGNTALTTACGVLSAIFITVGLLPQYYEIYKYKAVIGISLYFLLVDLLGGIFSLLSLVFAAGPFNTLGSLAYGLVALLEIGIFILAAILNPIHRRKIRAQRQADEDLLNGTLDGSELPSCTTTINLDSTSIHTLAIPEETETGRRSRSGRRGRELEITDHHVATSGGTLSWIESGAVIGVDMEQIGNGKDPRRPESAERSRRI